MRVLQLFVMGSLVLAPLEADHRDIVILRDGTRQFGTLQNVNERNIVFRDEQGKRLRFDRNQVRTIEFADSTGSPLTPVNPGTGSAAAAHELPAGTELRVRTNESIESKQADPGRTYSAVMDQEVRDATGAVAIPRGSDVELVVREMNEGGRVSSSELVLGIQTVRLGGRRYLVETADIEKSGREGIGANRRTATMIGGGAALGTLLGAIAGGGKGAAIGAAAGAAAGGLVQVLTKGKEVKVPAETVLTFRLDQPVRLQPQT